MATSIPEFLKAQIGALPTEPGVYFFKDAQGRSLYVGKALSIRNRVLGHFRFFGETFSKEGILLAQVRKIEHIRTPTEAEALLLESSLIKELQPKYNQALRDDKSYPYLKITAEEYPRLLVVHGRRADGAKYFGPYTSVRLLREAVKILRNEFLFRLCKKMPKKLCLAYHIGQCRGPCAGCQTRESYLQSVKEAQRYLTGSRDTLVRTLSRRMKQHAARREYEQAKILYDEIRALGSLGEYRAAPTDASPGLLQEFQTTFSLPTIPRHMECFDISNLFGREAVGSMAVFREGKPSKGEYRHFRIKTVGVIDDYRMIREVVRRRYERVLKERLALPDVVLIDGGKGHLNAAREELDALNLKQLPVLSIAKQKEFIFSDKRLSPYVLPARSQILQLIQRLRDEAHRFAIGYHRRLHRKKVLASILERVPGVGPVTRQRLLTQIGSLKRIAEADPDELVRAGKISQKKAREILEYLRAQKSD